MQAERQQAWMALDPVLRGNVKNAVRITWACMAEAISTSRRTHPRSCPRCPRPSSRRATRPRRFVLVPMPPMMRCSMLTHTRWARQVVAAVAVIEVPAGAWPELLPMLVEQGMKPDATDPLRQSVLETIGFMCEEIVRAARLHDPPPSARALP